MYKKCNFRLTQQITLSRVVPENRTNLSQRGMERNGVGGLIPRDKLIFIATWVAALSIGRSSGASHFVYKPAAKPSSIFTNRLSQPYLSRATNNFYSLTYTYTR